MGFVSIFSTNTGGLSDSTFSGRENSVAEMRGVALHHTPGVLRCQQKMKTLFNIKEGEVPVKIVVAKNGDFFLLVNVPGTTSSDLGIRQIRGDTEVANHTITGAQAYDMEIYDDSLYVVYQKEVETGNVMMMARWTNKEAFVVQDDIGAEWEDEWQVLVSNDDIDVDNPTYPMRILEDSLYIGANDIVSRIQTQLLNSTETNLYKGAFKAATTYEKLDVVDAGGGTTYNLFFLLRNTWKGSKTFIGKGDRIWAKIEVDIPRTETIRSVDIIEGVVIVQYGGDERKVNTGTALSSLSGINLYRGVFEATTTYRKGAVIDAGGGTNFNLYILLADEWKGARTFDGAGDDVWAKVNVDIARTNNEITGLRLAEGEMTIEINGESDETKLPSSFRLPLFTQEALDIDRGYSITALGTLIAGAQPYLIVGSRFGSEDGSGNARVFAWNTWGQTYQYVDDVPVRSINSFIQIDNGLLASAGDKGALYQYRAGLERVTVLPFYEYDRDSEDIIVHRFATTYRDNTTLIGAQRVDANGNITDSTIFSFGSYSGAYPNVLNSEYDIEKIEGEQIDYIDITSFKDTILVVYKKGGGGNDDTYHIGTVDTENKTTAQLITRKFLIGDTLPRAPSSISIYVDKYPSNTKIILDEWADGKWKNIEPIPGEANNILTGTKLSTSIIVQYRLTLVPNENTTPSVIGLLMEY